MEKKVKNKFGTFQIIFVCVFLLLSTLLFSAVGLYFFEKDTHPVAFGSITDTIEYILINILYRGLFNYTSVTYRWAIHCIGVSMFNSLISMVLLIGIVVWILRSVSSYVKKVRG